MIQDSLNQNGLSGLVRLVIRIIKGTLLLEGIGAVLYAFVLIPEYGFLKGTGMSVFTSVSAFCNAGIDLFGNDSMIPYRSNMLINTTTMSLIVCGGIGFTVWWDVLKMIREMRQNHLGIRKNIAHLTLHSKLALMITFFLIVCGSVIFFIAEYHNPATMGNMSLGEKMLASCFQSVTTRTAGFMSIPQDKMTVSSQMFSVILMFVGGSTAGTAGGIKTVTFGIIILSVLSVTKGKEHTEVFKRTIPEDIVRKALAIMSISLFAVVAGTMLLSVFMPGAAFMELLYETVSALATVGLSMGLTGSFSPMAKLLVIVLMFIGRIGPITMALVFTARRRGNKNNMKFPEEKVLVG